MSQFMEMKRETGVVARHLQTPRLTGVGWGRVAERGGRRAGSWLCALGASSRLDGGLRT